MQDEYRGFVKSLFVESLDYLVISSLDGKICTFGGCYLVKVITYHNYSGLFVIRTCIVVWGFDKKTVAVLKGMQSRTMSHLSQENSDVLAAERVRN